MFSLCGEQSCSVLLSSCSSWRSCWVPSSRRVFSLIQCCISDLQHEQSYLIIIRSVTLKPLPCVAPLYGTSCLCRPGRSRIPLFCSRPPCLFVLLPSRRPASFNWCFMCDRISEKHSNSRERHWNIADNQMFTVPKVTCCIMALILETDHDMLF